jgi:hypothetical protein
MPRGKQAFEDKLEQARIRRKLEEEARQFISDDNENPEDYEIDLSKLQKTSDGKKYKCKIFPTATTTGSSNKSFDLSKIDSTWNIRDRGNRSEKPKTLEEAKGQTLFDPVSYRNKDDKSLDDLVERFGSMDPDSSSARKFIDAQVKLQQKKKSLTTNGDEVRLRMSWEARLNMAHLIYKSRQRFDSNTYLRKKEHNVIYHHVKREDDLQHDDKQNQKDEKEEGNDSVWNEGPELPKSIYRRLKRHKPRNASQRVKLDPSIVTDPGIVTDQKKSTRATTLHSSPISANSAKQDSTKKISTKKGSEKQALSSNKQEKDKQSKKRKRSRSLEPNEEEQEPRAVTTNKKPFLDRVMTSLATTKSSEKVQPQPYGMGLLKRASSNLNINSSSMPLATTPSHMAMHSSFSNTSTYGSQPLISYQTSVVAPFNSRDFSPLSFSNPNDHMLPTIGTAEELKSKFNVVEPVLKKKSSKKKHDKQ